MIPISFYHRDDVFEREKTRYFRENFCLGSAALTPKKNSFRTFHEYFEPITVRNVGGIKIFRNVCRHRGSLIDLAELGIRPFVCGYHGWAYDQNGMLRASPSSGHSSESRVCLKVFPAEEHGGLVFLYPSADLDAQMFEVPDDLRLRDCALFYNGMIRHDCNWKVMVENVLEPYHISLVHAKSFVPMGIRSDSQYEWKRQKFGSVNRVVGDHGGSYYHHVFFGSNLFVSNTNGGVVFVSYFIPLSPVRTDLFFELWLTPKVLRKPDYTVERVKKTAIDFTLNVLNEDKQFVEAVQAGIRTATNDFLLSDVMEPRVVEFHKSYLSQVGLS